MIEIATSILNVEKEKAIKTFYNLEAAKTDYFHIDVMDGKFVKDNTFDKMRTYSEQIKSISNIPLDVHLMVEDVKKYIEEFLPVFPCFITIHKEVFDSYEELFDIINFIKEHNVKVGVSIKPKTNIEELYPILDKVHLVLIMTVEPGKGGQKLIPETIDKIRKLCKYREENNLDFYIEADGGINLENIKELKNVGADIAVCGTAIINSNNYMETIDKLKK